MVVVPASFPFFVRLFPWGLPPSASRLSHGRMSRGAMVMGDGKHTRVAVLRGGGRVVTVYVGKWVGLGQENVLSVGGRRWW